MNIFYRTAALALPALCLAASPAAAQDYVQVGTGVDYSSGDYGELDDTDLLAIPFNLKYQSDDDWYVRASVSWLDVKGPTGLIPGDGGVNPGPPGGAVTSRSGIGDVILAAGYSFYLGGNTFFDAVGKVKLPMASETKFLGTDSTDFTAQGELLHSMGDVSFGLTGGRRFNGSSDLFDLRDVWLAGGGIYYTGEQVSLGLDYEWREGSVIGSPDRSEATASLTYKLNEGLRLQGYGYTGFADGSPDLGGGFQVLYRFGQ